MVVEENEDPLVSDDCCFRRQGLHQNQFVVAYIATPEISFGLAPIAPERNDEDFARPELGKHFEKDRALVNATIDINS